MNGIVSHSMRTKGVNYKINFGLTMPLLRRVAEQVPHTVEVARMLWQDVGVRESLMLAPMVYPAHQLTIEETQQWIAQMPNVEIADACCKFLFSQVPFASQVIIEAIASDSPMTRYVGYRLAYALPAVDASWLPIVVQKAIDEAHSNENIAAQAASRLLTEMLLQPEAGAIVVAQLEQASHIEKSWRENLMALYEP